MFVSCESLPRGSRDVTANFGLNLKERASKRPFLPFFFLFVRMEDLFLFLFAHSFSTYVGFGRYSFLTSCGGEPYFFMSFYVFHLLLLKTKARLFG